ncbi:membrane protein [Haematobacter missouriensis]|uniref:Uncharacterized protein n=1 Tax=Haematobacter missouriensis TaxID=366616 RepID=A0A212AQQ6_9RHOB|nr:hypothetical protein [Haematobacter missouriensis]KFI30968.1 membrane protein [Haematobacter missouriensis]OWJ73890.1 hypothetical protein CDV53_14260 [Haematobacter missouriensis]OWJ83814.1 hypothetical protein CDV52_09905 [Haematobacter missouriensis]
MKNLITTKPLRYANKSMASGVAFTASARDADVLVRLGSARYLTKEVIADELPQLRAEYLAVIGKKPFYGWDADTLKAKIAEAK